MTNPPPRRARRPAAARAVTALAALGLATGLATGGAGCGAKRPGPDWRPIPYSALSAGIGDQPQVATVAAGGPSTPWLMGGTVVDAGGDRHVRIWSASSPTGPWRPASMAAVAGLDGPQETIRYLAPGKPSVAFGYRLSPDEGYPRPSTWVAGDGSGRSWREIHEDREFFGGPDIVSFGGMSEGPHGCFVSGTWTDARGRPVISIWRTVDGQGWSHDYTEPAFEAPPGQIPLASGVADGPEGVLVAGTVEMPTASDPGRQEGALWLSPDGTRWQRVPVPTAPGGGRTGPATTFDAVAAVPGGWLVAGTVTAPGAGRGGDRAVPAVWSVSTGGVLGRAHRLPAPAAGAPAAVPTAIDAAGGRVTVAAAAGTRAVLWSAALSSAGPARFELVAAPAAEVPQLQTVRVASGADGAVVVMTGADASIVSYSPRRP